MSKIPQSLFPMETRPPQVSDEAFNLFHSIDRELFARLINTLGRDPAESVRVMAFWMWLEKETKDVTLVKRLLSLPSALLNDVAEETLVCLRCAESYSFPLAGDGSEIMTLLPEILSNRVNVVTLRLIHENRVAVLWAVNKIINTVCARAFVDILRSAWHAKAAAAAAERRTDGGGLPAPPPVLYHSHLNVPFVPLPVVGGGLLRVPPAGDVVGLPIHLPTYDLGWQSQMLGGDRLGNVVSINNGGMSEENVVNGDEDRVEVAADDRTIFLTFSKGYPITEDEVREYFTRMFGDFIEDLIMQEVGEGEQVLYARMVARSAATMDGIVGGNKAKYVINGKHVWARKYVKKHHHQARWGAARDGDDTSPSSSSISHAM